MNLSSDKTKETETRFKERLKEIESIDKIILCTNKNPKTRSVFFDGIFIGTISYSGFSWNPNCKLKEIEDWRNTGFTKEAVEKYIEGISGVFVKIKETYKDELYGSFQNENKILDYHKVVNNKRFIY